MACGVGDTLVANTLLLQVHGAKTALPESELVRAIHLGFDGRRSRIRNIPFGCWSTSPSRSSMRPAINDPTTAVQAIDQIEDLLRRLGGRDLDAGHAFDANGDLRLIFPIRDGKTIWYWRSTRFGTTARIR